MNYLTHSPKKGLIHPKQDSHMMKDQMKILMEKSLMSKLNTLLIMF